MPGPADIKHIVFLMMENRSFDHYLGALNFEGREDIEGLAPTPRPDRWPVNRRAEAAPDETGPGVAAWCMDGASLRFEDPPHEWRDVREQWHGGAMDGFVSNYQRHHAAGWERDQARFPTWSPLTGGVRPTPPDFGQMARVVMGYYTRKTLPVLYALADEFAVCDHWHSSFLGSTHPNRVFAMAGHCGDALTTTVKNAFRHKPPPLLAAWEKRTSKRKGITWKTYRHPTELSIFALWPGFANGREGNSGSLKDFVDDCARDALPDVAIVEPPYSVADDHPAHDPRRGQQFLGYIVDALLRSDSFKSTAMIITYDEHGGFFDHVNPDPPPEADASHPKEPLDRLGVRVPTVVLSPYTPRPAVVHDRLEHTSWLRTVAERWDLPVPAEAGPRLSRVPSLWETAAFDFSRKPRNGKTIRIPHPAADWRAALEGATDLGPRSSDFAESLHQLSHIDKLAAMEDLLG